MPTLRHRLSKRRPRPATTPPDAAGLLAAQSMTRALAAGLVAAVAVTAAWAWITLLLDRVFPWFSIVQGIFIGMAVRRCGRGIDWRFPVLAAMLAVAAAIVGNFVLALPATAAALDVSAGRVLFGLTRSSLETFFTDVTTAVDWIYAGFSAAVAAVYSRRRLGRQEVYALRTQSVRNGGAK